MPRYEIQPLTDADGNEHFSVVDLLDVSGNNEVATFWTRHEAVKFIAISKVWEDEYNSSYVAVSLRDEDETYVASVVRLVEWVFIYGREV